jgi:Fe-S cluster biogenesis protein NfuA
MIDFRAYIVCLNIARPTSNRRQIIMRDKVEVALGKIRPALVADGGNVELVDVNDGVVKVKLTGACAGCPMSTMTLKMGIERILKQDIPEIKEVVSV